MVVIINGKPRAGKDLFVELCKNFTSDNVFNFSTVDYIKDLAKSMGWDGQKTPKDRKFLSDLKDLLTDWNDIPFKKVKEKVETAIYLMECHYHYKPNDYLIFIHCREPKEIDKLKSEFNAQTLLILRPAVDDNEQSNHADAEVFNYEYDDTVVNDGTILDYRKTVAEYLNAKNIKTI